MQLTATQTINTSILQQLSFLRIPVYFYKVMIQSDDIYLTTELNSNLNYYFRNTNHNVLILASSVVDHQNTLLLASLGKPLYIYPIQSYLGGISRNMIISSYLRSNSVKIALAEILNGLDLSVINLNSFNNQTTMIYSESIYHDREDNNYNVDDDLNHDRLINIEKKIHGF